MNNIYLAIDYICNENCLFCPCSENEKQKKIVTPYEELKTIIDSLVTHEVTDITISGGEPTLHPNLVELIQYAQRKGFEITLLSNSERFSNTLFLNSFLKELDVKKFKLITTLHSSVAIEHEFVNQTDGSFSRTIKGLQKLLENDVRIIIKHCITKRNYQNLDIFYNDLDAMFPENVDIQLCSIDYCGIPTEQLEKEMLSFTELRPYLESIFDLHLAKQHIGNQRKLYCINMPLCSCDVYYWNYISIRRQKMYNAYKDPHLNDLIASQDNVGINREYCKSCKAFSFCSGTYLTAFDAFGDRIIKPF